MSLPPNGTRTHPRRVERTEPPVPGVAASNRAFCILGGLLILLALSLIACSPNLTPAPTSAAARLTTLPVTEAAPPSAAPAADSVAPAFQDLCNQEKSRTAVQFQGRLDQAVGKKVVGWQGWVYDVTQAGSSYTIQIGMVDPSSELFWSRNVEIVGVPKDLAFQFKKEQRVTFSGTIERIDNVLGTYCNPVVIENASIK